MKAFRFQLLVILLVFLLASCGLLRDLNPCDCVLAQENSGVSLTLGQSGPGLVSIGQRVQLSEDTDIAKVSLVVSNYGGQVAPLKVTLYADNGSGTAPDTSTVIATSINTSVSSTTPTWVSFCFASDCISGSVALTKNVYYWIVVNRPTANTVSYSSYYWIGADLDAAFDSRVKVINSNSLGTWSDTNELGSSLSSAILAYRLGCKSNDESCQ